MAAYSIIKKSQLERASRLDGEYYQPKYNILKKLYKNGEWYPIRKFAKKCEYGISIKMNVEENGYPIFRMDDLKDGYVFDHELKYAPISKEKFNHFKMNKNEILFNRVNTEELVGRTAIFKIIGNFVPASYLVKLTTKNIEPDFLNVFLNCKYGKLSIRKLSRRAVNQANVNAQELQSINFPLLSDEFQKIISSICEKSWKLHVDSKNKNLQAEKILLSEIGYTDLTHSLTFTLGFKNVINDRRIDAEHYQPKYDKLRKLIQKYSNGYSKITDIAKLSKIKVDPKQNPDQFYNYIELANINYVVGTISESQKILGKDAPSRARMLLNEGQVIVSSVEGSIDKAALVPTEHDGSIASTGFFVLNPKTIPQGYLLALIKSPIVREQLKCEASGTILAAVSANNLPNILVPNIKNKQMKKINELIIEANESWRNAKHLFKEAIRGMEIAIEQDEKSAIPNLKPLS